MCMMHKIYQKECDICSAPLTYTGICGSSRVFRETTALRTLYQKGAHKDGGDSSAKEPEREVLSSVSMVIVQRLQNVWGASEQMGLWTERDRHMLTESRTVYIYLSIFLRSPYFLCLDRYQGKGEQFIHENISKVFIFLWRIKTLCNYRHQKDGQIPYVVIIIITVVVVIVVITSPATNPKTL